jgi:hypothetical protein
MHNTHIPPFANCTYLLCVYYGVEDFFLWGGYDVLYEAVTDSTKKYLFLSSCPSGTDGKHCETAPERCIGNPCMHGGQCQDFGSGLNCSCPDDYTGIGCQYEYDACAAGACRNGATCIDNGPGYTCVCPHGYTGELLISTLLIVYVYLKHSHTKSNSRFSQQQA